MKILIALLLTLCSLAEVVSPDQIITMRNEETGIKEYEYDIKNDTYAIELSYDFNANPMKASEVSGFRGQLTIFSDGFDWIGYAASSSVTLATATSLTGDFDSTVETVDVMELGLGFGNRSGLVRNFISNGNVYDEYSAVATYTTAETAVLPNSLSGFGMVASYGVFWRMSKFTHWGLRANYHLHSLEDATDPDDITELNISWISMAISLGMHF